MVGASVANTARGTYLTERLRRLPGSEQTKVVSFISNGSVRQLLLIFLMGQHSLKSGCSTPLTNSQITLNECTLYQSKIIKSLAQCPNVAPVPHFSARLKLGTETLGLGSSSRAANAETS